MKVLVIGAGWFGCHITHELLRHNVNVQTWESAPSLFMGASGSNPARLHDGYHYPRSQLTRKACWEHRHKFLADYKSCIRSVKHNFYAIAQEHSLIDFGTYIEIMSSMPELDFEILNSDGCEKLGMRNIEGALKTQESYIDISSVRQLFISLLGKTVTFSKSMPDTVSGFDWIIDCTFRRFSDYEVDRYEQCIISLLHGPMDTAITVMDGAFPGLYPWMADSEPNADQGVLSISSAELTPLSKTCKSWQDAVNILNDDYHILINRASALWHQMAFYYPPVLKYKFIGHKTAVRAMPSSKADARLCRIYVDWERQRITVQPGKIDSIYTAWELVRKVLNI